MSQKCPLSRQRFPQRGMVLVGVMLVLMLILAASLVGVLSHGPSGGSLNEQSRNALQATQQRIASYGAQNMADAGVRAVMQWLNHQPSAPDPLNPFRPAVVSPFFNSTHNGNYDQVTINRPDGSVEGTFDVRIFPYADNDVQTSRSYVIESIGTYNGKQQIVRAVATQDTFAKYAFFADNAPVNTYYSAGTTTFNGPVHINGRNTNPSSPDYNPNARLNILWRNNGNSNDRIFRFNGEGAFTTSIPDEDIKWFRDSKDNLQRPSTSAEWNAVATAGQSGIRTGAPMVDMPDQSTRQMDAALGSPPATIPTGPGVTVPSSGSVTNGGIYINGDVDNMRFSASGSGSAVQKIEVLQNDGNQQIRTTITMDPYANGGNGQITVQKATAPLNSTSFTNSGSPTTMAGMTNGVLYVNGNIGSQTEPRLGGISGQIANNVISNGQIARANNLCLVTESTKNININGNLTYQTVGSTNPRVPNDRSAVLGIVSNKVQIVEKDMNGNAFGDVTVDATVMAYDTFDALNALTRNYPNPKKFTLTGGYIAKNAGTFAGIDASGTTWAGFVVNRNYDSRVANRPPPYFPSTGNQYKIRSYQRVGNTVE